MDNILQLIGLAKRAGRLSAGIPQCEQMIKARRAQLVIIAADASENSKKSITDSCRYYGTEYMEYSDMTALGKSVGAEYRAVVSVNDKGLADAILKKYAARK